ncbi:uncharacterized protein C8Q71DRAFT_905639 [Rhodofomes roseus]|uniref:DUF6818 domain-containing protein n=1 Tax=Rhodofomes roseus TaxID=34475 RepID=A0ABQ8KLM5_9APHY|nr:uncharacterized protein C8Q71DRAFT_905639 [Rhodofomes roseus]KAH9839019.1 hypothetical protein C8Q71DRAFT_905639 [Rhodofomes roseus]
MSDKAAGKQKARRLSEDEAAGPPASEGIHGLSMEFRSTVPTTDFRSGGRTRMTEDSPDTHGAATTFHDDRTPVPAATQAGTPRPFHTHVPYNTPSYFPQGPSPPYSLSPPFDISSHSTSIHHRTNQASVAHPYPYSLPPPTEHEPSTYGDPYGWSFSPRDRSPLDPGFDGEDLPPPPPVQAGTDSRRAWQPQPPSLRPAPSPSQPLRTHWPQTGSSPAVKVKEEPRSDDELPEVSEILRTHAHAPGSGAGRAVKPPPSRSQKVPARAAPVRNPTATSKTAASKPASKGGSSAVPTARKRGRSPHGGGAPAVPAAPRRGGRQPGAATYTEADLGTLMDVVRKLLPLGPDEWSNAKSIYNKWALTEGRPERQVKPLRSKFEALARTPKPTGKAEVPWWVEEAWTIEELINERAHLRTLDDDAGIDGVEQPERQQGDVEPDVIEIFDSDEEVPPKVKPDPDAVQSAPARKKAKTTLASSSTHRDNTPSIPLRRSSTASTTVHTSAGSGALASRQTRSGISNNLLSNIATAFDPATQAARDDVRATRQADGMVLQLFFDEMRDTRSQLAEERRRAERLEEELRRRDRWEQAAQGAQSANFHPSGFGVLGAPRGLPASPAPSSVTAVPRPFTYESSPARYLHESPSILASEPPPPSPGPSNWATHRHYSPPPDLAQMAAQAAFAREEVGDAYIPLHSRSAATTSSAPPSAIGDGRRPLPVPQAPAAGPDNAGTPSLGVFSHASAVSLSERTNTVGEPGLHVLAAAAAASVEDSQPAGELAYEVTVTPRRRRIARNTPQGPEK